MENLVELTKSLVPPLLALLGGWIAWHYRQTFAQQRSQIRQIELTAASEARSRQQDLMTFQAALDSHNQALLQHRKDTKELIDEWRTLATKSATDNRALTTRIEILEGQLAGVELARIDLHRELKEAQAKITKLSEDLDAHITALNSALQDREALAQSLKKMRDDHSRIDAEHADELRRLNDLIVDLRKMLDAAAAEIKALQDKLALSTTNAKRIEDDLQKQLDVERDRVKDLTLLVSELNVKLQNTHEALVRAETENATLRSEIVKLQAEIGTFRNQLLATRPSGDGNKTEVPV